MSFLYTDLFCNKGLQKLLEKFDSVFKVRKLIRNMKHVSNLKFKKSKFERASDVAIDDYLLDFELLHNKMNDNDMSLSWSHRGIELLDFANSEKGDRKFAVTIASDMVFWTPVPTGRVL